MDFLTQLAGVVGVHGVGTPINWRTPLANAEAEVARVRKLVNDKVTNVLPALRTKNLAALSKELMVLEVEAGVALKSAMVAGATAGDRRQKLKQTVKRSPEEEVELGELGQTDQDRTTLFAQITTIHKEVHRARMEAEEMQKQEIEKARRDVQEGHEAFCYENDLYSDEELNERCVRFGLLGDRPVEQQRYEHRDQRHDQRGRGRR